DQWQQIGIRAIPREEDRTLLFERGSANEWDIGVWTMDRCFTPFIEPLWFMVGMTPWLGLPYNQWYNSGGVEGELPPPEIEQQFALYDRIKGATPEELPALAEEFFDSASENLWFIGVAGVL